MKENILVVGGYGQVGQTISRNLAELYPGKVFAAGRRFDSAAQFSSATGGKVRPLQLDINRTLAPSLLEDVRLVIMCLDQTDTAFVRSCLGGGVHYVDVSASHSFLALVEGLHTEAVAGQATAVLSVGLTPGLTNLLARHATLLMDRTDVIDISVMLGLGDQHGKAAIEWMIDNLGTSFEVTREGRRTKVAGFSDGQQKDFGALLGRRRAYRINVSDQHVLPRTLGVPTVSTRLCFDSAVVTGMLAGLRASGVFHLLNRGPLRAAMVRLFGALRWGTDMYAVKIDAWGEKNQQQVFVESLLQGKREAVITARVAAGVAAALHRNSFAHGVYHIEQLFGLESIWQLIQPEVSLETRMNGTPASAGRSE